MKPIKHKGFEIRATTTVDNYDNSFVYIFKDGKKFSNLCLATVEVAKRIIDSHAIEMEYFNVNDFFKLEAGESVGKPVKQIKP